MSYNAIKNFRFASNNTLALFACGFNVHGQIPIATRTTQDVPKQDIFFPQCAFFANSCEILFTGWSDTVYQKDGKLYWCGSCSRVQQDELCDLRDLDKVIGSQAGPVCILSKSGELRWCKKEDKLEIPYNVTVKIENMAIAGNGRVCVTREKNQISSYRNIHDFSTHTLERTWQLPAQGIVQLIANEYSFTLLTIEGDVYTWGDSRYSLGRALSKDEPSENPCVVTALEGLPISQVSTGGWNTAALSEAKDLYVWGNAAPGSETIESMSGSDNVSLVDLGDEVNIQDIAVGSGHLCVLADDGEVYITGKNDNGQIGIGLKTFQKRFKKMKRSWKGTARAVYSGPFSWTTFIIVETNKI